MRTGGSVGTPVIEWQGRALTIPGWSRHTGLSHNLLYARYKRGLRPPELFETPRKQKQKARMPVMIRGVLYPGGAPEAAKALGVAVNHIYKMNAQGLIDTVGVPGRKRGPGGYNVSEPRPLTIGSMTYPSRVAAAAALGITVNTLYYRLGKISDLKGDPLRSKECVICGRQFSSRATSKADWDKRRCCSVPCGIRWRGLRQKAKKRAQAIDAEKSVCDKDDAVVDAARYGPGGELSPHSPRGLPKASSCDTVVP